MALSTAELIARQFGQPSTSGGTSLMSSVANWLGGMYQPNVNTQAVPQTQPAPTTTSPNINVQSTATGGSATTSLPAPNINTQVPTQPPTAAPNINTQALPQPQQQQPQIMQSTAAPMGGSPSFGTEAEAQQWLAGAGPGQTMEALAQQLGIDPGRFGSPYASNRAAQLVYQSNLESAIADAAAKQGLRMQSSGDGFRLIHPDQLLYEKSVMKTPKSAAQALADGRLGAGAAEQVMERFGDRPVIQEAAQGSYHGFTADNPFSMFMGSGGGGAAGGQGDSPASGTNIADILAGMQGWGQVPGSLTGQAPGSLSGADPLANLGVAADSNLIGLLMGQAGQQGPQGGFQGGISEALIQQLLGGGVSGPLRDALQSQLAGAGFDSPELMAQVDPQLQQQALSRLMGQNVPQADANFGFDEGFAETVKQRAMGEGVGPSFQEVVSGQYEPIAAELDRVFNDAQSKAFEDLVGRGVLDSGEAQRKIEDLAVRLGTSKAQVLGDIAVQYAQQRNDNINQAIQQYGILENNRASLKATITQANLGAAVSTQNAAMQTLQSLNTAMIGAQTSLQQTALSTKGAVQSAAASTLANAESDALRSLASLETAEMEAQLQDVINQRNISASDRQVAQQALTQLEEARLRSQSAERISGAEIASREKIVGEQIASDERIAGQSIAAQQQIAQLDASTRSAIASQQAQTQLQVANISAQAALQQAQFNQGLALQQIQANMALQGVDWGRYMSDPTYQQNIVNQMAIRQDTELAVLQAGGANQLLNNINPGVA